MLIARKSLNALQSHESFLTSLNRLSRHLSRLAQANMHAVLRVRRRPKQAHSMPLARDLPAQVLNLHQKFCVLKLLKSRRISSTFVATESVTCFGQHTFNGTPRAVERCCKPILVISRGARSSDFERANSSPSTNTTCMASAPCRAVHRPQSSHRHNAARTLCHRAPAAQIAASCGHAVLAASTLGKCQTNLHAHESQCKHLQTNRTVLQSPASDRRKQNTCFKAVHEEVGWCQQQHARAILLSLRRPPCSWLGAGNQHARLERKDGEICPLCYIAYRSKPILQRAETSSSKFPLTIKLLLSSMEAAAFVVVACAYAAFTVRRHLLVSNALGKARHAQFWSCPNFSQTYLVADLAQAPSPRCADAPGQQISVVANVLAEHEFVQAVGDWLSFWSVDEDQPPILLLLFSLRSFAVLHASRCYRTQLWAPVQAHTLSLSTLGQFLSVDGAGVTSADTGAFASIEVAVHLKAQNSALSSSAHSSSHFGVRGQTTIACHNMRAAQHELPLLR